ncbi:single-stranded DNA-binding protein [Glutamicibacter bergerei]|jgi:single-strand DNA-binding protein|uniref:Single-stranded DNA-binding protein n=2 Tax=Glutamicibacter TaxID=1742989 RepID=A0ABV9MMB7_9MICC|nr:MULTISPECIES: single-stranded DNA-binding protein [Micrococcaceae]HAY43523.1 single-stranded DNA-binding protein [Micrococcaceae bacterium]PRB70153.1 single-stranded DNA-binding protein [Arthrobacter sp. MYb213]GGJ51733.1 single-stranded DNA-binding protein [Glutamicibacter ardleyensis]HBV09746.1 single-stranded DNA-binding protein [Micrococcaceae bacterium]HJX80381.1 single-stranded DNA-binding protein [Glutamicibacter sp.]
MAGETVITVIGNLTADPELRFTPSGSAVANFTIASTPRTFDRQSNEWKDGEALFLRASVWREAAENVAETFTKGMRVIAQGRLRSRSYDTKEGERRTVMELEVDEIGPSLRFASAKVTRTQRSGGGQGGFGNNGGGGGFSNAPQQNAPQAQPQQQQQPQQGGGWNAPSNDPWSTGGNNGGGGGGGWGNPGSDEPPF